MKSIDGTTPRQVNLALKKLGINGTITRDRSGYYYFLGDLFDVVPSWYSYNLHGISTQRMVDYVLKYINSDNE